MPRLPTKCLKLFGFIFLVVLLLSSFVYSDFRSRSLLRTKSEQLLGVEPDIAALGHPSFADIRDYERNLPQHVLPGLWTKTQRRRYLYISGEAWGSGWNNVFQEQLINTHMAYLADRGYVFRDFAVMAHPPFPDTLPDGSKHHLQIPMNAFVSGPTGGGPLFLDAAEAANSTAPRAISKEFWDAVCPESEVVHITLDDINAELNITGAADEHMEKWAAKLRSMDDPCITIDGGAVFSWILIGGPDILPLWRSYHSSPALKAFAWSALIARALERNFHLLSAHPPPPYLQRIFTSFRLVGPDLGNASAPYPLSSFKPFPTRTPPFEGLLGLHVRRGDYEDHCNNLAAWTVPYMAWNAFGRDPGPGLPALPDVIDVPEGMTTQEATHAHCWPTPEQIVARARAVRTASASGEHFPAQRLRAVYVSTNGKPEWVAGLAALLRADGWESVGSSVDMQLAKDEQAVSQAIDMSVLVAAESFIGVGFSSMTSNVVQLRLSSDKHPHTCRFW